MAAPPPDPSATADSLRADDLVPRLRGRFGRVGYVHVESCASTQHLLEPHDPEGSVAVSEHQTAGRGRLGRRWEDAAGTSLLVSVLLRPRVGGDRLPTLSPMAGRACAEAIAEVTGLAPTVKFPNDVLVGGRKVAGVLAEASDGRVLLGIGVNVNGGAGAIPREVRLPATSLSLETGAKVGRGDLLVALLERLERRYADWLAAG